MTRKGDAAGNKMAYIFGTAGDDELHGTVGDDLMQGLAGNDTFFGLEGNDTLGGGIGIDSAVYGGILADYALAMGLPAGGGFTVTDLNLANGNDGDDVVVGVERLQFADATVDTSWSGTRNYRITTESSSSSIVGSSSVAGLVDGGFVVTWDYGGPTSDPDILGQRYDGAGRAVGTSFRVNTVNEADQIRPAAAALADGGFVVTWQGAGSSADSDIYAQRYDAGGKASGKEFRVNTTTAGDQVSPSVAALANGDFVVSWDGGGPSDDRGIYGQRFGAAGSALGTEFRVNTTTSGYQTDSSVATLLDGGFMVAWGSTGNESSLSGIFGQRYDSAGVALGEEFRADDYVLPGEHPSASGLAGGGFVVAWSVGGPSLVRGRQYDAEGVTVGAEFQVDAKGRAQTPAVSGLADGGFVVAWDESSSSPFRLPAPHYMSGERYDAAGGEVGVAFQISATPESASVPAITGLADGGFVATWDFHGNYDPLFFTLPTDVYGQRYDALADPTGELNLTIRGDASSQRLVGLTGNDKLIGLGGNDVLDGSDGFDCAGYLGLRGQYGVLAYKGQLVVGSVGDGLDSLRLIEALNFADQSLPTTRADSALEYIASYTDLMGAFGANEEAGYYHFTGNGYAEGRTVTFNGLEYIASYADLMGAFGTNTDAGASHYITQGRFEGRAVSFDGLEYIASYGDLINAFGANADAGASHYITQGRFEGRITTFNGLEYIASYGDLINAFGTNADAGATHYIVAGHTEGRHVSFDGLEYIASYGDLINAFHNQVAATADPDIGANHYIVAGYAEHRAPDLFDAAQYLANYADLQAAFGNNTEAATFHFVTQGYFEGRTDSVYS